MKIKAGTGGRRSPFCGSKDNLRREINVQEELCDLENSNSKDRDHGTIGIPDLNSQILIMSAWKTEQAGEFG